jgi:hypothetical protein
MVMLASTITASTRAQPASTAPGAALDAAVVIG